MGTLLDRAVIRVTGEDSWKLLNDTLTGRFQGPMGLEGRWFALLSPQGKIQIEGIATEADGAIWLDVDRQAAPAFLKRMKLYRLRAKVEIDDVSDAFAVWWSPNHHHDSAGTSWQIFYGDNRAQFVAREDNTVPLGQRALIPRSEAGALPTRQSAYDAIRVAAGIAELGADFAPDSVFPHDIGMDLLGGIDFVKGCYIGQEVVSRMKHRGTARRRPVILHGVSAAPGSAIITGGRDAGTLGLVSGGDAVGIVRLDRFDGGEVTVGGNPVRVTLPAWATYRLGESAAAD